MAEIEPLTVDRFPLEKHKRYAEDQAKLDQKFLQDARVVPLKTEVSVLKPYTPTELGEYLETPQPTLWASFTPPPDFSYGKPLFSYQVIPSLGGYEKQEGVADRLQDLENQDPQEERERQAISKCLKTMGELDKNLGIVNAQRNRWNKG